MLMKRNKQSRFFYQELQASFNSNSNICNCVLRLGGSHMCLSFSGAIRHLKKGSSILSIFRQIYLELSVPAILSEKKMHRGIKAHILLYRTLMGLVISKVIALNRETNLLFNVQEMKDMVSQLMSKDTSENELQCSRPNAKSESI